MDRLGHGETVDWWWRLFEYPEGKGSPSVPVQLHICDKCAAVIADVREHENWHWEVQMRDYEED